MAGRISKEVREWIKEDLARTPPRPSSLEMEAVWRVRAQEDQVIVCALRDEAGLEVSSVWDLVNTSEPYPEAIPVLIKLLSQIEEPHMKEGIVRALTVKEARGVAAQPLIEEFKRLDVPPQKPQLEGERDRYGLLIREPTPEEKRVICLWHLKWAIGNALSVVADERVIGEIMALLRDKRHGGTRDALVWALVRLKPPGTKELLLELLDDEDDGVAIQASLALGRLGVQEARDKIEKRFLCHRDSWFRQQAKRALAKLDKAKEGNLSPPAP